MGFYFLLAALSTFRAMQRKSAREEGKSNGKPVAEDAPPGRLEEFLAGLCHLNCTVGGLQTIVSF